MLRKSFLLLVALLLVMGTVWASDIEFLEPQTNGRSGPVAGVDQTDDIFYLQRFTSAAEYYLGSGSLGDTMCVAFQPIAQCSILYAQLQWYIAGSFQSFMWDYSEAAEAMYPDGRSVDRGTSPVSPLGDIVFGPFNNSCTASQDFEDLFTSDDLPGGGVEWGDSLFVVGFVKTQDDGAPNPLADDVSGRRFTYTWFGGPWMDTYDYPWGAYSSDIAGGTVVDLMMRVAVSYYAGAPPIIGSMNQLPNTINTEKVCTVNVPVADDNGWTTDVAHLRVLVNGSQVDQIDMEDPDADGVFTASFDLSDYGVVAGDQVAYYVHAVDDEGAENSNADDQLWFYIVELENPDAPLLVVDDGMSDRANVLLTYLDDGGYAYEWWDTGVNKGIDEYTVNAGFPAVFVIGWGAASVPTRAYGDDAYSAFLEAGGNFLFSDMDYFYANGEPEEPIFAEGDFAYDFFAIESGTNDPVPTDSTFFGEADDVLSGDFADDPYVTYPNVVSGDWADFAAPTADGEAFFSGVDLGLDAAIRHEDGDQKIACFTFDIVSAAEVDTGGNYLPTDQFTTLMDNLMGWYGIIAGVDEGTTEVMPLSYSLSQNYPNPFNPTTHIRFTVPTAGKTLVKVYNVNGREVATLFNGYMAPGSKVVEFDGNALSSGVYFVSMNSGSFNATRKMVLLK